MTMGGAWYKENDRRRAVSGSKQTTPEMQVQVLPAALKNYNTMNEELYLLETGNAKSAWKAWQTACFREARKYDRRLFTRQQIAQLAYHLEMMRPKFRNFGDIHTPDWDFCDNYNTDPTIVLGYDCVIGFSRVKGFFNDVTD